MIPKLIGQRSKQFYIVVILILLAGCATALYWKYRNANMPDSATILIFGIDDTKYVKRSDSIMVVRLDKHQQRIGILSIPRDTRAMVPGHGMTKMNHAYAYGGAPLLRKAVSQFIKLPIDYYIGLDIYNVAQMIDTVGGIPITVEKDFEYHDRAGHLDISIKKGPQVLDGKTAVNYMRFRRDRKGDLGRIQRQQRVGQIFASQLFSIKGMTTIPRLFQLMQQTTTTNVRRKDLVSLVPLVKKAYQKGNLDIQTVPGSVTLIQHISYWNPDVQGLYRQIQTTLLGRDLSAAPSNRQAQQIANPRPIVEIIDHSTRHNTAAIKKKISPYAQHVFAGSPSMAQLYDETFLVIWKKNIVNGNAIAQSLGIASSNIIIYDKPTNVIDMSVVIGNDRDRIKNESFNQQ